MDKFNLLIAYIKDFVVEPIVLLVVLFLTMLVISSLLELFI